MQNQAYVLLSPTICRQKNKSIKASHKFPKTKPMFMYYYFYLTFF